MIKVVLSAAISADGYLDDKNPERLRLSSTEDWAEVERERAACDAILVGAETVRRDNPSLLLKSGTRHPLKVTVTSRGNLDENARFFTGDAGKIVFCSMENSKQLQEHLGARAEVLPYPGERLSLDFLLAELSWRGVKTLLVEGGGTLLTQFLSEDKATRLRLAMAPFFVGEAGFKRWVEAVPFPWTAARRMKLGKVEQRGDMAVMHYHLGDAAGMTLSEQANDDVLLARAVSLAQRCPPSATAYAVGAVLRLPDGQLFTGFSRERPNYHAEEVALEKCREAGCSSEGATMYSSMEPCLARASRPHSCSALLITARVSKVVFCVAEPDVFLVNSHSAEPMHQSGIKVIQDDSLAVLVREVNPQKADSLIREQPTDHFSRLSLPQEGSLDRG